MDAYLRAVLTEMESAIMGLSDNDLNALRRAPGKWTAAQTLEHLILAFTSTTRHMIKSAERRPAVPLATLKQRIGRLVVVGLGHMPEGRTAPEFTRPVENPSPEIAERFRQAVQEMDEAINACERIFPPNQRIAAHPILGPLTARQWRKFHLVHTRHHMKQVRTMRRAARSAQPSMA